MAQQTKNFIKTLFENGDIPTQDAFWDWLDSYFHKSEMIPIASVNNLQNLLDNFAPKDATEAALLALLPSVYTSDNVEDFRVNTIANIFIDYIVIIAPETSHATMQFEEEVFEFDLENLKSFTIQFAKHIDANGFIKFTGLPNNSIIKIYKK